MVGSGLTVMGEAVSALASVVLALGSLVLTAGDPSVVVAIVVALAVTALVARLATLGHDNGPRPVVLASRPHRASEDNSYRPGAVTAGEPRSPRGP